MPGESAKRLRARLRSAKRGWLVADLRAAAAEEAAKRFQAEGFTAAPVAVDIGNEASVNAMVENVLGLWGRIDILVN